MTLTQTPITAWRHLPGGVRMRVVRKGEPVIVMCPKARCADDPKHQPDQELFDMWGELVCCCGEFVDEHAQRVVPAF